MKSQKKFFVTHKRKTTDAATRYFMKKYSDIYFITLIQATGSTTQHVRLLFKNYTTKTVLCDKILLKCFSEISKNYRSPR